MGWENLEPIQDRFPIKKSRHKNMLFTSVNVHLANGKNTCVWKELLNTTVEAITRHIDYDDSPVIRTSKFESEQVLGGF